MPLLGKSPDFPGGKPSATFIKGRKHNNDLKEREGKRAEVERRRGKCNKECLPRKKGMTAYKTKKGRPGSGPGSSDTSRKRREPFAKEGAHACAPRGKTTASVIGGERNVHLYLPKRNEAATCSFSSKKKNRRGEEQCGFGKENKIDNSYKKEGGNLFNRVQEKSIR